MIKNLFKKFLTVLFISVIFSNIKNQVIAASVLPFDCAFNINQVAPTITLKNNSGNTASVYKGFSSIEFSFDLNNIKDDQLKKLPSNTLVNTPLRLYRDSPPVCGEEIKTVTANRIDVITHTLNSNDTNGCTAGAWGPHEIHLALPDGRELCQPGKYQVDDYGNADIKIAPISDPANKRLPAPPDVDAYWSVTISNARFTQGLLDDVYVINLNSIGLSLNTSSSYLFDKGNLGFLTGSNFFKDTVSFILNPLEAGSYSIRMYGRWGLGLVSGYAPFTTPLTEAYFTVYDKGKVPTPTPIPTLTPIPSPTPIPDECRGRDAREAERAGDCSGYERCFWCQPTAAPTPRNRPSSIPAPPLMDLCEQLTIEGGFQEKCRACVGPNNKPTGKLWTAVGCVPINYAGFINEIVLKTGAGIAGGVAFLYFLYGAFLILTSSGNAEKMEEAKQIITSALAGLILIIFSVFILHTIGVDILKLPGFG